MCERKLRDMTRKLNPCKIHIQNVSKPDETQAQSNHDLGIVYVNEDGSTPKKLGRLKKKEDLDSVPEKRSKLLDIANDLGVLSGVYKHLDILGEDIATCKPSRLEIAVKGAFLDKFYGNRRGVQEMSYEDVMFERAIITKIDSVVGGRTPDFWSSRIMRSRRLKLSQKTTIRE